MRLQRMWWAVLPVMVMALLPAGVRADGAIDKALAEAPADSALFVCLPDVKQLDADIGAFLAATQLNMMVPPPFQSVSGLIRMYFQLGEHYDDSAPMMAVMLPAETPEDAENKKALSIPVTDTRAALEALGGEAGEGDMWSIQFMGTPSSAMVSGNRLIIAANETAVRNVAEAKKGLAAKLKPHDKAGMSDQDLVVWADAEHFIKMFRPQIDGVLGMLEMMATMQEGADAEVVGRQMAAQKKQIAEILDSLYAGGMGLSLSEAGLGMRFTASLNPGSRLHEQTSMVKPTTESMLAGLPAGQTILAVGQITHPDMGRQAFADLKPYLELSEAAAAEIDTEKYEQIKKSIEEMAPMLTAVRASVTALPPSPKGLIGMTLLLDTTDADKFVKLANTIMDSLLALPNAEADEELREMLTAAKHTIDAEDIGGAKVHQLSFDLSKIPDADEDELESVMNIIGQDGVMLRYAAVDDKTVLFQFGGGSEAMSASVDAARSKQAPLEETPGVKKVLDNLPSERLSLGYIALDRLLDLVQNIQKAIDEEPLPIVTPMIDAPIAMASTGGEGWARVDVQFPMEVIREGKNVVMTMMMMNATQDGQVQGGQAQGMPAQDTDSDTE